MTHANSHWAWTAQPLTAIALGALAAVSGCIWVTDVPAAARPIDPPAIYTRWWSMTEACSGRTAPFGRVHWYRVPGGSAHGNGDDIVAYYSSAGPTIVVSDSAADYGAAVRHEMLHALLNVAGHPREQFLGACADVVDCPSNCVADAGKWNPGVSFETLPVDSMNITGTVQLLPREQDGQRWVTLEVTAENPKDRAILAIPNGATLSWGVDVDRQFSTSWSANDSSMLFFAPRQTRRWFYELRVANDSTLHTIQPGTQLIFGAFGQHWTTPTQILVAP